MLIRHYFIYVPADFGKVLLALIYGGISKSRVFKKLYTLGLASFQLEHPLDKSCSASS